VRVVTNLIFLGTPQIQLNQSTEAELLIEMVNTMSEQQLLDFGISPVFFVDVFKTINPAF
jgi:hypothetical protein